VTALEVSGVALERAAAHPRDAGVTVNWVHAGLVEAALPPATFDLVSAQYPALLRTPEAADEQALLAEHHQHESGVQPAHYVWPASGAGAHPVDDLVLRARRIS
jgi:hypothetical protein